MPSSSLLIVGCSQSKRGDRVLLPAIERYDGPSFRTIRRFLRQQPTEIPDIYILSAKFGLIYSQESIKNYDQKMTEDRARELQSQVVNRLEEIINSKRYKNVFICVSKSYWQALDGYESIIPDTLTVKVAEGGVGKKLRQLYEWLYGESAKPAFNPSINVVTGRAILKGVEIVLTPTELLEKAREAIATGDGGFNRYKSWYIIIDDLPIAPKWLVSQLTDLPVSDFTASDARRVLIQLGFLPQKVIDKT